MLAETANHPGQYGELVALNVHLDDVESRLPTLLRPVIEFDDRYLGNFLAVIAE